MGCKLCIIYRTQRSPQKSIRVLKKTSSQHNIIKLIKLLPCNKKQYSFHEFKKFQYTVYNLIVDAEDPHEFPAQNLINSEGQSPSRLKNAPYKLVKNDLLEKQNGVFRAICKTYSTFLSDLFGIEVAELNEKNGLASESHISTVTFDPTISPLRNMYKTGSQNSGVDYSDLHYHRQNYSYEVTSKKSVLRERPDKISQKIQNLLDSHVGLGSIIAIQCNLVFRILRRTLLQQYQSHFNEHFSDPDNQADKEIMLHRLVQHFLLTKGHPLYYILPHAISSFYKDEDSKIKKDSVNGEKGSIQRCSISIASQIKTFQVNEPNLDRSLMPRSFKASWDQLPMPCESSEDSSCVEEPVERDSRPFFVDAIMEEGDDDSQIVQMMFSSKHILPLDQLRRQDVLNIIRYSETEATKNQIPYDETFPLIMKIIGAKKFWKKFKLIETVDQFIVKIYMRCRSASQFGQFYDTISAADSKVEILFFILYKFKETYPQINLDVKLYQPLRFMNDFDGVLHENIKNVFCPSFVRFFSILNMYIQSEV